MPRNILAACALVLTTVPAAAQSMEAPPGDMVTLSPEQREAAIEAGATRAHDESLQNGAGDRRVHGEMGVEIGNRGQRAAYGTLVTPIGQNGMAAFSYGTGQGPRWSGRRGRFQGSSVGAAYSNDAAPVPAPAPADAENVNPD